MKPLTPEAYQRIETAFLVAGRLRGLHHEVEQRPILLTDIVNMVTGLGTLDSEQVMEAVNSDLNLRRLYLSVVSRCRIAHAPREALAQDDEKITQRTGRGFILKFRESRATSDQVYVILEVDTSLDLKDNQVLCLVVTDKESLIHLTFPPLSDGRTQCILQADDRRLEVLRNPFLEINLLSG